MTRFARAKGSKSSNERAPEDSTPWEVMKEQLLDAKKQTEEAKKREEAENKRIENYENFLKDHKVQKRKATWCDFPEAESTNTKVSQILEPTTKKKKKNKQKQQNDTSQAQQQSGQCDDGPDLAQQHAPGEESTHDDSNAPLKKKLKMKKQKKQNIEEASEIEQGEHIGQPPVPNQKKNKNKKNKKQIIIPEDNLQMEENDTNNTRNINNTKSKENKNNNKEKKKKKQKNMVDGQAVRRKPINDNSFQLIINGKEVELVRFEGFPIMKKDADRLSELKSNMMKKGIPKSEVQRTLKLERRRAEKALARLKRDVCYNCRKGGHNLSDCPELKTKIPGVGGADGVCFKCGSTEHRQFECKVQKDKEFRFATCFICKEPGHIARQCPDNPKGLYPNGGSCKLCGDVTHLRKDCPTVHDKREESSIKLQTLDSAENLEGIEQSTKISAPEPTKTPKKIKF